MASSWQIFQRGGLWHQGSNYDDVNETFVDSVAVSFVFLLFKYDFFKLDMLSTRNFFRDLFFICFEFECLFNFANHICILYMYVEGHCQKPKASLTHTYWWLGPTFWNFHDFMNNLYSIPMDSFTFSWRKSHQYC